ncbi:hypothetical protein PIB30_085589 [Stylosanthes scabra]|uniref:Uncharacterized protein n=1 Tax=Stylosanthes scabra TaxID=79078 RepID=A0ABU6UVA8_9FABA|nr:hypothetical protein [Stylosanthes scabra]
MDRNGPSPSTKGKGKAFGPPTRASPRLAALRSQPGAKPQPETPATPTISAPASSLPPKKCQIQKKAGEGTSKAAALSFRRRSQRIAAIGRTFFHTPTEQKIIALSSESEPEHKLAGKEEGLEEAHQDAGLEEQEEEEDPEEDPKKVSAKRMISQTTGPLGTQNQPTALLEAAQDLLQQTSRRMIAPQ